MTSGRIFDVKRYSLHDGPGIRTTVFLQGCPLSCWWCHNPESQNVGPSMHYQRNSCLGCQACVETCDKNALTLTADGIQRDQELCQTCGECAATCPSESRQLIGRQVSIHEVLQQVEKDRLYYDESGGGVTFSGGEPLAQPEFLIALLRACGEQDLHRVVDTSGLAATQTVLQVAAHCDLFLFDLKLMDDQRHRQTTGVSNQAILKNLRALDDIGQATQVRVPVIPGINDTVENFNAMAEFLMPLKHVRQVDLLPFHPSAREKHRKFGMPWKLNGAAEIAPQRLEEFAEAIRAPGLQVEIGG
ncbi:MAG: glycyl-radical enzyme activating protein [Planctomycetes bacterium]|nr:glycyl-radical enzyme activating protein [Planctomycetota bacterium]